MTPGLYVTCSFALNCGVPAALLLLDLRSMRSGRPDGDVEPPIVPSVPPMDMPPELLKPLPECLIPRRGPQIPRQVEPARELELT